MAAEKFSQQPKPDDGPLLSNFELRDLFAAFVPEPNDDAITAEIHVDNPKPSHERRSLLAIRAELRYRYADAMLVAREKKQ